MSAMKGAAKLPILAAIEAAPNPMPLTTVGYCSVVMIYTRTKQLQAPNLPIEDRQMISDFHSAKHVKSTSLCFISYPVKWEFLLS